jgi:S-adenosylmethionine synthetase
MNQANKYIFTSESVTEGHPDKVCDFIADSILDAYLVEDANSHVACEVLCKGSHVVLAGEINSHGSVNREQIARQAIREIGYIDPSEVFNAHSVEVHEFVSAQSPEIAQGVNRKGDEQGAGDQGMMFGYATDESTELMPLPILLAHKLARGLAEDRHSGRFPWLRPDGKTQVSVLYENSQPKQVTDVVVSTQHAAGLQLVEVFRYVASELVPRALGAWNHPGIKIKVNPTHSFIQGGPSADCGVTGRKIIVDTYGGMARHGGGAFSGKDPSKVDRSAAYFCRYVARQLVKCGLARRAEVQVAYAIGVAQPVSVKVDTFGSGDDGACESFVKDFDFRPRAIIERLDLLWPIYRETTNYGHFGKTNLPWED